MWERIKKRRRKKGKRSGPKSENAQPDDGTARRGRLGGSEAAHGKGRKGEQRQKERRQEGVHWAHHPEAQQRRRKLRSRRRTVRRGLHFSVRHRDVPPPRRDGRMVRRKRRMDSGRGHSVAAAM